MNNIKNLPPPEKEFSFPLMKAFETRRSKRKWKDENLSEQELSNLLWSACGITKEETKRSKCRRTTPSATNSQIIKLYIALKTGLYLYDEKKHHLILIKKENIIKHISNQKIIQSAPAGLIYVSDYSRMKMYLNNKNEASKWFVSGTETGFISQNVYLYCAAAGLNTVIIGLVNRDKLHEIMELKDYEKVVYTQAIGKSL